MSSTEEDRNFEDQRTSFNNALATVTGLSRGLERTRQRMTDLSISHEDSQSSGEVQTDLDIFASQLMAASERLPAASYLITNGTKALLNDLAVLLMRVPQPTSSHGVESCRATARSALKALIAGRMSDAAASTALDWYSTAVAIGVVSQETAESNLESMLEALPGGRVDTVASGELATESFDIIKTLVEDAETAILDIKKELGKLQAARDQKTTTACLDAMRAPYKDLLAFYITLQTYRDVLEERA